MLIPIHQPPNPFTWIISDNTSFPSQAAPRWLEVEIRNMQRLDQVQAAWSIVQAVDRWKSQVGPNAEITVTIFITGICNEEICFLISL